MTSSVSPGLTRRAIIRRGTLGGALLLVGGATFLGTRSTTLAPLPQAPLRVLTPAQYSVLLAVVSCCVPLTDSAPDAALAQATVVRVDETLALADARTRGDFTQLLGLLDNALVGLLLDGRPSTFTALDAAGRDAALESWRVSRLALRRTGYQALRRLSTTHFYGDPANQLAAGYPGPPKGVL